MEMSPHKIKMERKKAERATRTVGFTPVRNSERDARKQRLQQRKIAFRQFRKEQIRLLQKGQ